MKIETESMVPIEWAERDFSQVLHLADQFGTALIIKNNLPRYFSAGRRMRHIWPI